MSDEVKKPEAGEWWQRTIPVRGVSNVRMYMVGRAFDGRMIGMRKWLPGEISDGADFMFGIIDGIDHIEHLPGCDSWEWKPEAFPQWWTTITGDSLRPVAYVLRESKDIWALVYKDGTRHVFGVLLWCDSDRTQLTKEQAEAMLDKPNLIQSDPEEWVEINKIQFGDMIPRSGVDVLLQDCDSNDCANDRSFITEGTFHIGHSTWKKWKFVCRRRDLPKIEPKTKRVAVRLYWYDGNIVGRYDHSQPTDESFHEIKSDGNGGWYVESSL